MALEKGMASPSPRMASPTPRKHSQALNSARPFFYEIGEEELPAYEEDELVIPGWLPAFKHDEHSDIVSDVSTSAGPSPCREDVLSPLPCRELSLSPVHRLTPSANSEDGFDVPTSPSPEESSSSQDTAKWVQVRKIFVGGSPHNIDQNSLYKLFNKFAKVKKAWLQMFRADSPVGRSHSKKHRGFGFVIFADKDAVDSLLGDAFSKFIAFGDGLTLDVKRAVGKGSTPLPEAMPMTPGLITPGHHDNVQDKPQRSDFASLPNVPPFPCSHSPALPWQCQTFSPMAMPVYQMSPQAESASMMGNFVPGFPFEAYVRNRPQELEIVLRQAMPDFYDD
jgi:hypothetical protein